MQPHACEGVIYLIDEIVKSIVKFENTTNISILEKGRIAITLKHGSHNFLYDVFYVLSFH